MASINIEMAVSGAQQCTQQIKAATTSVKQMQSALKLADSEFKLTGDATAMYTSKIQTLQAQIAAQTQAVEAAKRGLETMTAAYGENSSHAAAWQAKLNTAQAGLNNLQASLNEMSKKLEESSGAMGDTTTEAGKLADALNKLPDGSDAMDGLNDSLDESQEKIKETADQLAELQDQLKGGSGGGGAFFQMGDMIVQGTGEDDKSIGVMTNILKQVTSIMKSAAETAGNTQGLEGLFSGMTAGSLMSGVGNFVGQFGPYGALASAFLDMAGTVADIVSDRMTQAENKRREASVSEYWSGSANTDAINRLAAVLGGDKEISADVEANITAKITASVGDLRVVIEEMTEDGKVNRKEAGSVKKYVEDVLMSDYDEAVEELMRMRGELWKLATQGFTDEEVAQYAIQNGTADQKTLYQFMVSYLLNGGTGNGDSPNVWDLGLTEEEAARAAANLWMYLAKIYGSPEAVEAAFKDPAQHAAIQGHIHDWMVGFFDEDTVDTVTANRMAANMMTLVGSYMETAFSGTNLTGSDSWFRTTVGGGIFVQWVKDNMGDPDNPAGDYAEALKLAGKMWSEVLKAASSPEAAVQAMAGVTGAEAAAEYEKKTGSDTAKTFGAMVQWVMKTLPNTDKDAAIALAIRMWDEVKFAAYYGQGSGETTGTVATADTSWIDNTEAGTFFTAYIDKVLGGDGEGSDYQLAIDKAKQMWGAVVAAASSPEAAIAAMGSTGGVAAAQEYVKGSNSDTAKAFGVFVQWVNDNLMPEDENAAIQMAVEMWDTVRRAAFFGIDQNGTDHKAEPPKASYTFAGSEAMQKYIEQRMGVDFETAINKANTYWDNLMDAIQGKTSGNQNGDLRADLLDQALTDYKKTLEEITQVTSEMPGLTGNALDEKIKELEVLLDRAEALANRIDILTGEGLTQAEGAYNLVTYGKGNYTENDVKQANEYLNTLKTLAEQSYADTMAEASAARNEVYQKYGKSDTPEARAAIEAADKAYEEAKAKADADYAAQTQQYVTLLSELLNAIIDKESGKDATEADKRAAAMALIESGVLDNLTPQQMTGLTGTLRQTLFDLFFDSPILRKDANGKSEVIYGAEQAGKGNEEGVTYTINGKEYAAGDIPLIDIMRAMYGGGGAQMWSELMGFDVSSWYANWKADRDAEEKQKKQVEEAEQEGVDAAPEVDTEGLEASAEEAAEEWTRTFQEDVDNTVIKPPEFDDEEVKGTGDEVGKNLAESLAASIDANAGLPAAAAGRMAERIEAAIKQKLGIASPSKVMMAFGQYTAAGLAEGIDAGIAMVDKAATRMAGAVVRPMGSTVNNSVVNNATSSLYIDKYYQQSDADIDYLSAQIADKNRLGRMGNGLRG